MKIRYDYSYCSELLKVIEEAGMIPPRNPNATFEQQLEHNGLNFWEEENKSK